MYVLISLLIPCFWTPSLAAIMAREQDAGGGVFSAFQFMATPADSVHTSGPHKMANATETVGDKPPGSSISAFSFLSETAEPTGVPSNGVLAPGGQKGDEEQVAGQLPSSFSFISSGPPGVVLGGEGSGGIPESSRADASPG